MSLRGDAVEAAKLEIAVQDEALGLRATVISTREPGHQFVGTIAIAIASTTMCDVIQPRRAIRA